MFRYQFYLSLLVFFISAPVTAATLIEIKSVEGGRTRVITDGSKARIDMSQDQSYVLIDYKTQSMHVVLPKEKQIMDMSGDMPAMAGKPPVDVKVSVVPAGKGPDIAGYSTNKFTLKANGETCGTIYGSLDAMKELGIGKLLDTMQMFEEKQRASMGSYADMIDPCKRAGMGLSVQAKVVGVPMRDVDTKGNVDNEIVRIDSKAPLPANAFSLPGGYKTIIVADQMKQVKKTMTDEANEHQSEMEEMMKQMQQSGSIHPETMEEMKRLKAILMYQQQ